MADATTLTEGGLCREDVENIVQKLQKCDYDVQKHNVVLFILMKLTRSLVNLKTINYVMFSGEGVQQALLKIG